MATKEKVDRVAKHELLDSTGAVTTKWEEAAGIRYTDLATNLVFEQKCSDLTPQALLSTACFGMRTLATNEASAARNGPDDATGAEQVDAVRERFAGINAHPMQWTSGTREGGPRIDQDVLAEAVVDQMVAEGKWTEEQRTTKVANILATLKEDPKKVATLRSLPGVEAYYKRRKGTKVASADDVDALLA
jgi:hypothetical protein